MTTGVYGKLVWHTPSLDTFLRDGVGRALAETHLFDNPLLVLLAARWFECFKGGQHYPFVMPAEFIGDLRDSVVVISDYAASSKDVWWKSIDDLRASGNLIVKFSCVGDSEEGVLRGALNAFDLRRLKPVTPKGFYDLGCQRTHENQEIVTVPMGCASSWLPPLAGGREKVVLLDEIHNSIIDVYEKEHLFDVAAFKHALKVCDHLHSRGYRIVTFCRSSRDFVKSLKGTHPYLEIIDWDGWMPFTEVVKHYARAPLFYTHVHEAHGYPIYENLQLGNAVVGYAENINSHVVRQFQNGLLLASTMPPDVAASLIDAYFERYENDDLQPAISRDAHERFSCDTFLPRLVEAFARKGITFA